MFRKSGLKAGSFGIADQVALSLANLAVGLLLARELEPAAFGIYIIVFTLHWMGISIQIGLITDPLMILGPQRGEEDREPHASAILRIQIIVGAVLASATLFAAFTVSVVAPGSLFSSTLLGLALALLPAQVQGFLRALFLSRLRADLAFLNDLVMSILRVGGIVLLSAVGALTPFAAFAVMGVAASLAIVAGLPFCSGVIFGRAESTGRVWAANWAYGRWLLATSAAYWCSGNTPVLMASVLLSPVAAAVIKAAQYLVSPVSVLLNGLDGVMAPRAAQLRANQGQQALRRFLWMLSAGLVGFVAIYGAAVVPASPWLMSWLYKGRYAGATPIVALLALEVLFAAAIRSPLLALRVRGETKTIFIGYLASAIVGFLTMIIMAPAFGIVGAAAAVPASSATLLVYLLVSLTRVEPSTRTLAPRPARALEP